MSFLFIVSREIRGKSRSVRLKPLKRYGKTEGTLAVQKLTPTKEGTTLEGHRNTIRIKTLPW